MPKTPPIHVVPRDGGKWAVEREGGQRASSLHETLAEAAAVGRQAARENRTEFNLHGRNGQVREKDRSATTPPRG